MHIENMHYIENMLTVSHKYLEFFEKIFLDFQAQPAVSVKDEPSGKVGSDHGEEEMEVDSADEQEEDARNQSGQTQSQISKSRSVATFNTLSSLSSLRPGILFMLALKHSLAILFFSIQVIRIHCLSFLLISTFTREQGCPVR